VTSFNLDVNSLTEFDGELTHRHGLIGRNERKYSRFVYTRAKRKVVYKISRTHTWHEIELTINPEKEVTDFDEQSVSRGVMFVRKKFPLPVSLSPPCNTRNSKILFA
jgi:hypothetical protein